MHLLCGKSGLFSVDGLFGMDGIYGTSLGFFLKLLNP